MIESFADKRTENVFNGLREKSFPESILRRARSKLDRIDYATRLDDLRAPPGNRLEAPVGKRAEGAYASSGAMAPRGASS